MKDLFDLFGKVLSIFSIPLTGWSITLFLLLYIFRDRLKKISDRFLDWAGTKIGGPLSYRRFEPTYRKCIRDSHQYMKIVGIRTEEEQRPKITDAYVPIRLLPSGSSKENNTLLIEEIVHKYPYSLILGDPGAGKSTLLDFLTVKFTEPPRRVPARFSLLSYFTLLRIRITYPCPIYIHLRACLKKNESLLDDILDPETRILSTILPSAIRNRMPKDFIQRCIERRHALLLLDGLDEVTNDEMYGSVVEKVNNFIKAYPENKVVVTCRKAGWRGDLDPIFRKFFALPLDYQQEQDFIYKWYATILKHPSEEMLLAESDIPKHAEEEANHLFNLVKVRERLRELANNPMMLSLICLVHRQKRNLPRGRAELYQDCLQILLEVWDRKDKDLYQDFPSTEEKKHLMRCIAYHMQCEKLKEIDRQELVNLVVKFMPEVDHKTAPDIVKQIEIRSGLMMERSIDKLAFSHLTLQEFLVVEYLRNELDEDINLTTITDWAAWREPILLMCGIKKTPNPFISELHTVQPLFAVYGIAEVDPTRLDIPSAEQIITSIFEKVRDSTITIDEALPALTSLMSIEKNPFGHSIVEFIYSRTDWGDTNEVNKLIEVLCNIPTREAAKIILNLLTKNYAKKSRDILISGLARIGEPAIYEALEWHEKGLISEDFIFRILIECESPLATKTLWLRYKLDPPRSAEVDWAKAWALRLSHAEHDRIVRSLITNAPGITDTLIWPYRKNDKSAIAAIVKKAVEILRDYYNNITDIYREIDIVSKFDPRIQIPLLLSLHYKNYTSVGKSGQEEIEKSLYLNSSATLGEVINRRSWYTLGALHTTKPRRRPLQIVQMYLGIGIECVSILFATLGIKALLLPRATFFDVVASLTGLFSSIWQWFPPSAQAIIEVILFLTVIVILYLTVGRGENPISEGVLVVFLGLLVCILFPLAFAYYFIWSEDGERIERLLATQKANWAEGAYVLSVCTICGVLSFFALKPWIIIPPLYFVLPTAFVVLLGILFQLGPRAFQKNPMANWLQVHPLGHLVLDEFAK